MKMLLSNALIVLALLFWIVVAIHFVKAFFSPVKTVKAVVADKYIKHTASRFDSLFKRKMHIVVFKSGSKKLLFCVSPFSYDGYAINEKGTLTYKGNRLIDFK